MDVMVDLPLCLQQLRSTLSDEERRRSRCHGSGSRPTSLANAQRSKASLGLVVDTTPTDPAQRGCLWTSGTTVDNAQSACRNLLDFKGSRWTASAGCWSAGPTAAPVPAAPPT